jgi:anti-anti-sigma factor
MELVKRKEKNATVIQVKGRLDAGSSPELEKEIDGLAGAGEKVLLLDLAELNYISSAGLRVILVGAKKLKNKGGSLSVSSLVSVVKEVFDISGFSAIIPIFGSAAEGLEKI